MRCALPILAMLLLVGCMPHEDRTDRQHHLIVAKAFAPVSLDPAFSITGNEFPIEFLFYEQLFRLSPTAPDRLEGMLAESWSLAADGLALEVRLHAGHRFSSGRPVDAAAVKFSLERVLRVGRGPAALLGWLERVEVAGPLRVRLIYRYRYGPALQLLAQAQGSIVDPREVEAHPDVGGHSWLSDHSAGSGSYLLADAGRGDSLLLVANPFAPAPRAFTTIEFRFIPDESVRRLLLEHGDIDLTDIVPAAFVSRYRALDGVAVQTAPGGNNIALLVMNTRRGRLTDVRLRRAVAAAIDYGSLRDLVLRGNALLSDGYLTPGTAGYDAAELPPRRDLAAARAWLATPGYRGPPLVLVVSMLGPVAEFLQANLADAGIPVTIERRSPGAMQALQESGQFDLMYTSWASDTPDAAPMLDALYTTAGIKAGTNGSFYSDPRIDWLTSMALAEPLSSRRGVLEGQIDDLLRAARPAVVLFAADPVVAYRSDIMGMRIDPLAPQRLDVAALSR